MANQRPIKRYNLADEVVNKLQQQISKGIYVADEKLPTEPELMQLLGVGRSTVREAIRILANAGVVRVQQGRGTFVEANSPFSEPLTQRFKRASFEDLDEIRQMLDLKIVEKAAQNRTEAGIERISMFLRQRKEHGEANNIAECITADINFHISIAEASGNDMLSDLYKAFSQYLKDAFVRLYSNTDIFIESQALHEALLQSIIDKQAEKAGLWAAKINGSKY